MARFRKAVIRTGLETLYYSGAHGLMRPFVGGAGAIFTMHHVRPLERKRFQPNRLLEITPQFLEAVIVRLRRWNIDLVSLDEMHRRLTERDFKRRFACFTFDDAYKDNKAFALPIMRKHGVPFALFVPTNFPDRLGLLWWLALEAVVASTNRIVFMMDGRECHISCETRSEKEDAYEALYWWLRDRPSDDEIRDIVRDLAARYQVDIAAFCERLCMTWDEIGEIAREPLATIGAHTVTHPILAKIADTKMVAELRQSRAVIEAAIGVKPEHLAYPFGQAGTVGVREFKAARDLGYKTAVTTHPGMIFPEHAAHLWSLPRISLNGEFQELRHLRVLMSGAATAFWNGFRRVEAA